MLPRSAPGRGLLALTLMLLVSPCSLAQVYEDAEHGFRLVPPKKWQQLPRKIDENWVVAKFVCDREYFWNNSQGWSLSHKPELTVIAFLREKTDSSTGAGDELPDIEKPADPEPPTPPGGPTKITATLRTNRDYREFLKNNYYGGGYYFSAEEERETNGLPTTCYEIKVEKGAEFSGPKRIVTWVFRTEAYDFAVQFEVLEDSYDKLRSTILKTLKSFKEIEREGTVPDKQERTLTFYDTEDWTPEEREELRQLLEEKAHEDAIKGLPDDWEHKSFGNILVLSHGDMKYGKTLVDQTRAVMTWLDKEFYFVGPDEYVRGPILRICKDWEEENSFRRAGDLFSGLGLEIVTHKVTWATGSQSYEFRWVNGRIMDLWFQDRDKDLYWALPNWLRSGLRTVIEGGVAKGSRLEFQATTYEKRDLREAERNENLTPAQDLMQMTLEDLRSNNHRLDEAAALVRFLMQGGGGTKKAKNALAQYIANVKAITEEADRGKEGESAKDKPKTEAEEEEYYRKQANAWKEKERLVLDQAFERTFGGWSDGDWKAFEASYLRSMD